MSSRNTWDEDSVRTAASKEFRRPWDHRIRHLAGEATRMDITIRLSPEEEKALLERASASGDDVVGYIRRLIERHVRGAGFLSELLAPIRREFADSGLSEDE